ncbi:hypothetical protein CLAFUW4_04144 [Fulvia fulva]|uniref:Uncharacterized protein n=1 Tax=Passalora fulva TaxID=5499 RepID=A0A9Q8LGA2_PASFU|nr:uncharacterized protein CLAFUR5_04106 [Fulvia fulva]KAK4626763.1 hypothetical protein CLAFUR4_04130 [Fulvia fulva]KAK4628167.1 hypothetical protein CLAFUR0_04131 [Fulvia fulva]UJO16955.1 hypothetical protein CLAFUR5_04106 [Fulvia fulva]WPV13453.1 hypothetical protein CLAFUW4_04144 [Fulvia fulva]WPV28720.1 hypothetical protein CLAFUW7_04133 [Fulvia fulva]
MVSSLGNGNGSIPNRLGSHRVGSHISNGGAHGTTRSSPRKKLILNAFVEMCLWRHPDDKSSNFNSIQHWIDLAVLLQSAPAPNGP